MHVQRAHKPQHQPLLQNNKAYFVDPWNNAVAPPLFFLVFIFIGSYCCLNLFIGVIVDSFSRIRQEFTGEALLSSAQIKSVNMSFCSHGEGEGYA